MAQALAGADLNDRANEAVPIEAVVDQTNKLGADMIVLLGEKRNLSREDAYTLCSLAADLRVTQTVNGSKGIHCMIAKAVVHG